MHNGNRATGHQRVTDVVITEPYTDPLPRLLADARAAYASDIRIPQLTQLQPPVTVDLRTGARSEEPSAIIGRMLSGRLLRLLGHPDGYGEQHPWLRSLWRLRYVECRGSHRDHFEMPAWRGSLCHQVVRLVVVREFSLVSACQVLEVEPDRTSRVLVHALRWIEADIDDRRSAAERREKVERDHRASEGLFSVFVREHDVERERRRWERMRARYPRHYSNPLLAIRHAGEPLLSAWEDELRRRRDFHREKGCGPDCTLLDRAS